MKYSKRANTSVVEEGARRSAKALRLADAALETPLASIPAMLAIQDTRREFNGDAEEDLDNLQQEFEELGAEGFRKLTSVE